VLFSRHWSAVLCRPAPSTAHSRQQWHPRGVRMPLPVLLQDLPSLLLIAYSRTSTLKLPTLVLSLGREHQLPCPLGRVRLGNR